MPQILQAARDGSVEHLRALGDLDNVNEHYSLLVLDVFLYHLHLPDASLPYSYYTSGNIDLSDQTLYSLGVFVNVNKWCKAHPDLRTPTAERIAVFWNPIVFWMRVLLATYNPEKNFEGWLKVYEITSLIMRELYRCHDILYKAAIREPAVLKMCLILWLGTYADSDEPVSYPASNRNPFTGEEEDTVITIFYLTTRGNPAGMADIIMKGNLCSPEEFIRRTVQRMAQLVEMHAVLRLSHINLLPNENRNTRYLVHISNYLIEANAKFAKLYMAQRAPRAFGDALHGIAYRCSRGHPTVLKHRSTSLIEILGLIERVVHWAATSHTAVVFNLRDVIGSAAAILTDCMTIPPTALDPIRIRPFENTIRGLLSHSTNPKVLAQLLGHLKQFANPVLEGLKKKKPAHRAQELMEDAIAVCEQQSSFVNRKNRVRICDNLGHEVVYCSRNCQTEDWDTRHKYECERMYSEYLERKHNDMWCSHSTRCFHLTSLLAQCNYSIHSGKLFAPTATHRPTHFMAEVDPTNSAKPIEFEEIDLWIDRTRFLLPKYLHKRFDDLLMKFKSSLRPVPAHIGEDGKEVGASFSHHLVDGVLRFGKFDIHVVAILSRTRPRTLEELLFGEPSGMNVFSDVAAIAMSYMCPHTSRVIDDEDSFADIYNVVGEIPEGFGNAEPLVENIPENFEAT
ncbi:hypothetical protein MD484_g6714, partial [Candolleomyces efflorescens]